MLSLGCHVVGCSGTIPMDRGLSCGRGRLGFVFASLSIYLCFYFCPQIGDHKFSAHRIVLAASIPYFHAMFTNDMMECKQDEIVMQGMDPRYPAPPLGVTGCSQGQLQPCAWGHLGALSRIQYLYLQYSTHIAGD